MGKKKRGWGRGGAGRKGVRETGLAMQRQAAPAPSPFRRTLDRQGIARTPGQARPGFKRRGQHAVSVLM
jgi:hypothetical protein